MLDEDDKKEKICEDETEDKDVADGMLDELEALMNNPVTEKR